VKEIRAGFAVTVKPDNLRILSRPVKFLNFGFLSTMMEETMESRLVNPEKEESSGQEATWKLPDTLRSEDKKERSALGILYKVTDPFIICKFPKYFL
jgi:hypothetical protein